MKIIDPITQIPPYDASSPPSFLGFPAMQNRNSIPCWSYMAELHKPARIIELGTYEGGFSILLAIMARRLGIQFITYDNVHHPTHDNWFFLLATDRRFTDIYDPAIVTEIQHLISSPGPTWLLCDNGDKPREWATFAPSLKPNDLIAAHDHCESDEYWICREFDVPAAQGICKANNLVQVTTPNFAAAAWYVCTRLP